MPKYNIPAKLFMDSFRGLLHKVDTTPGELVLEGKFTFSITDNGKKSTTITKPDGSTMTTEMSGIEPTYIVATGGSTITFTPKGGEAEIYEFIE